MAVTSLAWAASPQGDEDLVGGGEFRRAETVEDERERDLGVVHRCSQSMVAAPHTTGPARRHREHDLHLERSVGHVKRLHPWATGF